MGRGQECPRQKSLEALGLETYVQIKIPFANRLAQAKKYMKLRADQLLLQQGLVQSREQGKRLIMAGKVYLLAAKDQKQLLHKPGQLLSKDTHFILEEPERFVSRGGYKLQTALDHFELNIQGFLALDIGASTGGFTDCLLQAGAKRVYALDVGYGQLHWKLRSDKRVINLERINFRYAASDLLPELVDLAVMDCSFISLRLILPAALKFLKPEGQILALVKPQFEVKSSQTKKGIVRSTELQDKTVQEIIDYAHHELGLKHMGTVAAGIRGPKGNQEYLVWFQKNNRD